MQLKYGMGAMNLDTGAGFVDVSNYEAWQTWQARASASFFCIQILPSSPPSHIGKGGEVLIKKRVRCLCKNPNRWTQSD
jgi:hypothetical protein